MHGIMGGGQYAGNTRVRESSREFARVREAEELRCIGHATAALRVTYLCVCS